MGLTMLCSPILQLTNNILGGNSWPEFWKHSIVRPIGKPGKQGQLTSSYRPVALLCAVSKIVEKVMHNQLLAFLDEKGILPSFQHGFRPARSCDTAIANVIKALHNADNSGNVACLSSYDYSAAFDTVSVSAVLSKLERFMGVRSMALIESYMTGRSQTVHWGGAMSSPLLLQYGVPQGSILGPLLYIIATIDFGSTIISRIKPAKTNVEGYADDTNAIVAASTWDTVKTSTTEASDVIQELALGGGGCF